MANKYRLSLRLFWARHPLISVLILGFFLRISYFLIFPQIFYADSIFQILEQGYRSVSGYGIIPIEYILGIRHWLLPGVVSMILKPLKILGFLSPYIYTKFISIFFSVLSLSIPFSIYRLTKFITNNQQLALLTAAINIIWYELIYFSSQPFYENIAGQLLLVALTLLLTSSRKNFHIFSYVFIVTAYALRPQYLPSLPIIIWIMYRHKHKFSSTLILAGLISLIIVGLIDKLTWGNWWYSSIQYLFLHISNQVQIFKTFEAVHQPQLYYFLTLFLASGGLFIFSLQKAKKHLDWWLLIASILIPHTLIGHKEYRFIFLCIPILLMLSAINLFKLINKYIKHQQKSLIYTFIAFTMISCIGFLYKLPLQSRIYSKPLLKRQSDLIVYQWLNQQSALCGLYDATQSWMTSGGYYYLGKDVPLYTLYYPPPVLENINYVISHDSNVIHDRFTKIHQIDDLYVYKSNNTCQIDIHYTQNRMIPSQMK